LSSQEAEPCIPDSPVVPSTQHTRRSRRCTPRGEPLNGNRNRPVALAHPKCSDAGRLAARARRGTWRLAQAADLHTSAAFRVFQASASGRKLTPRGHSESISFLRTCSQGIADSDR
jgi:hypothetical protein